MTSGSRLSRDLTYFGAWYLPARALMLAALGILLRGREICDDLMYQRALADDPWMILQGRGEVLSMYAPFEGFATLPLFRPLNLVLPEFYAWRLTFLAWEALMGVLFVVLLNRAVASEALQRRLMVAFVLCPACWMASVVMPQDEVLIGAFLALSLALVAVGRPWGALLACGLGVVVAKVYLVLALGALMLLLPVGNLLLRGLVGGAVVVATYAWMLFDSWSRGAPPPLAGYVPEPVFGINIWVWVFERFRPDPLLVKRGSSLLALGASAVPVLLLARHRDRLRGDPGAAALDLSRVLAVMYLWFFTFFVQVNPEYYALFVTTLLVLFVRRWQLVLLMVAVALPWATNLLYGIRAVGLYGLQDRQGKAVFLDLYQRLVPLAPETTYWLAYWAGVVALASLTILGTVLFARSLGRPVAAREGATGEPA